MGLLDRVIDNEQTIATICGEIKTAANEKGAGIQDLQSFSEWPTQIRTIPVPFIPLFYTYNNRVAGTRFLDTLTVPTEAIDTTGAIVPLPNTTLQFYDEADAIAVLSAARKLIIPAYFQNADLYSTLPNDSVWGRYACHLEEIDFLGTGNCSLYDTNRTTGGGFHMKRFYAPEMTGNVNVAYNSLEPNSEFEVIAPKSSRINYMRVNTTNATPVTLTGVFSAVTYIQNTNPNNNVGFDNITCDLEFPSCTTLGNIALSKFDVTLRLPQLTTMTKVFSTVTSGTGVTALYLGGNVSNIDMDTQDKILANSSRIAIHIPAGDSTTKTTLDNAGITYTQDYVF